MDYITTKQAGEKWHISDRRVRMLCTEGKIPGILKPGKSYQIPAGARKPADGRERADNPAASDKRYLKWDNEVVGVIYKNNAVYFNAPEFNEVMSIYTRGQSNWPPEQFNEFLAERVVGRGRRDIERILFRLGLSRYDAPLIAELTRGIHPKDLLWIAKSRAERLEDAMTDAHASVFLRQTDLTGDSVDTPEGGNIKRYGAQGGQYGVYKRRISPLTTDAESEVAVYLLGKKLGVSVCAAVMSDKDTIFSTFRYDFSSEHLVHFRSLFDGARSDNEYQNLIGVRPQYRDDIARMILLDFITRQEDRHLSNMAIKISGGEESFYALYDNGRSLFYEDTAETVKAAIADPAGYATGFGYAGTYWDYTREIARERGGLGELIRLDVSKKDVRAILTAAGLAGYRFAGALEWILKTMDMVRSLA
ncbi:MAG: hypothetical protein LBK98_02755 [Peptococcaceae bacterium]|jgi:hypothetical protein|nr:hypothetical protein [Peptococcaceae bacterium]